MLCLTPAEVVGQKLKNKDNIDKKQITGKRFSWTIKQHKQKIWDRSCRSSWSLKLSSKSMFMLRFLVYKLIFKTGGAFFHKRKQKPEHLRSSSLVIMVYNTVQHIVAETKIWQRWYTLSNIAPGSPAS